MCRFKYVPEARDIRRLQSRFRSRIGDYRCRMYDDVCLRLRHGPTYICPVITGYLK